MNRRSGFTLIELLVVIAIVALLIAILIPALQTAKRQATGIICMANLNGMTKAWHVYQEENDARLVNGHAPRAADYDQLQPWLNAGYEDNAWWVDPPHLPDGTYSGEYSSAGPCSLDDEARGIETGALFPYAESVGLYHCPGDKNYLKPWDAGGRGRGGKRSYSITGLMNGEQPNAPEIARKHNEITTPGDRLVFLENTDDRGWNMGSWIMNYNQTPPTWIDPLAIFHNDRSTFGFADGHAEKRKWVDQSTLDMAEDQIFGQAVNRGIGEGADIDYMDRIYVPGVQ